MRKILIRADDLGYSEAVNYGIEKSVKNGLIRSVGVMMNMPATSHGIALLEKEDIAFGQHTNICVGRPLTDPKHIPSLVDEAGSFKSSTDYRTAEQDFVVFEEVLLEIGAQYQAFLSAFGRKPDYFEGHAIVSETFFRALEYFANQHGLTYSGLPENVNPNAMTNNEFVFINDQKVYLVMEGMFPDYNPTQMFERTIKNLPEDGVSMLIFHPGYLDDYILNHSSLLIARTKEVEMLINPNWPVFLAENKVTCIDYREL